MKRRIFMWTGRVCLPLMAVVAAATTVLNYYAVHNFHTIDKHLVFRERILHGFSTTDVMDCECTRGAGTSALTCRHTRRGGSRTTPPSATPLPLRRWQPAMYRER